MGKNQKKRVWLHLKNKQTTENVQRDETKNSHSGRENGGKIIGFDLNLHTISCG